MNARAFAFAAALLLASVPVAAQEPVHGSHDVFRAPGIALAWAVQRGADEATTMVVVRLAADPARYAWVAVRGIDPFTKAEQVVAPPRPIGGTGDVRIPRAQFADTPRTEWQLYASEAAARAGSEKSDRCPLCETPFQA